MRPPRPLPQSPAPLIPHYGGKTFNGIQTFPGQSPFGMNGRFVYGKVTVRF